MSAFLAFVLVGLGIIFSVTIQANISAAVDRRLNQKAHHAQHFFDAHALCASVSLPRPQNDDDAPAGIRLAAVEGRRLMMTSLLVGPFDDLRPRLFDAEWNRRAVPPPDAAPNQPPDTPWDPAGLRRGGSRRRSIFDGTWSMGAICVFFSLPLQHNGQTTGCRSGG